MKVGAIQLSAILASLLLSAGLVLRISSTLTPLAPETRDNLAAEQALQIKDGAFGVPLFDDQLIAPGETLDRCITIRAVGTRTPDQVEFEAVGSVDPALAPWLRLEVARGPALGDGRSCAGFSQTEELLAGSSQQVLTALDSGVAWTPRPLEQVPGGHGVSYRVRAHLLEAAPDEIQGTEAGFDLTWKSPFDPTGEGWLERFLAIAIRFSEDSIIPMLAILALGILFLGIQDRLDVATPRLSEAALFDDIIEFEDRVDPDPET